MSKGKEAFRVISKALSWILLILLIGLAIIPVLDLPLATSVPVPVWVLLILGDVLLIVVFFRQRHAAHRWVLLVLGCLGIAVLAGLASQIFASTPAITGPNSIAALEKVTLGGTEQWITIRGKDVNKPLLLYLGIGGPGAGGFPASAMNLRPLEDHFVVVNWDQRGTGKSYYAAPSSELKVEQFISDANELTLLLKERFHRDKIYVLGLSWGSILGTRLVHEHPEHFYAYIGNGQMVNTTENDRMGYRLALQVAAERGDKNRYDELVQNGEPPYTGEGMALKYAAYNDVLFEYMGSPTIDLIMLIVPQFAREYGLLDKVNFARGLYESFTVLYPQLQDLDFTTQAARLEVPMYFVVGRHDINAMASLVERYYNILQAPHKEIIWLESGHGAGPEELLDAMLNHVLITSPPLDKQVQN